MHLADIGEPHIVAERRDQGVALDDLPLVVARFGRGISPDFAVLGIDLRDRQVDFHDPISDLWSGS